MALLPLLEIVIRKFYASGIPGSATWVQHLALWVGFLGAAIAARKGEMLSLTAGSALLKDKWKNAADVFTTGVGFAVCAVLAKGSLVLVLVEREGGRDLALGLPVWVAQTIMPIGFSVIGIRILARLPGGWRARAIAASFVAVPILLGWTEDLPGSGVLLPLLLIIVLATTLGAPIFVGLGGVAAVLLWNNYDPVSAIAVETYNLALKPILPTIPLFTLAGYILAEGGTPGRLVRLFRSVFGWMPGGVAIVAIGVCAFFTSFTGGSGVTILAMGGLLYPMLLEEKYPEQFSSGLLTSAGSLGLLFPPSLAVILYGLVAEIDIRKLFVSGWVPAILEITLVAAFALLYSRRSAVVRVPFHARRALAALWQAKWEVAIPVILLGSILGGFATLVEAAAVTVLYALLLEFVIYRDLHIRRDLLRVVGNAATLIGGVLIILGVALGLTNYLVIARIPLQAVEWVQNVRRITSVLPPSLERLSPHRRMPHGHLLRDRCGGSSHYSPGARLRCGSVSPGYHLSHEPGAGLLDPPGRHESLLGVLSLQTAAARNLSRRISLPGDSSRGGLAGDLHTGLDGISPPPAGDGINETPSARTR